MQRRAFLGALGGLGAAVLVSPTPAEEPTRIVVDGEVLCFALDEPLMIRGSVIEIHETVRHRGELVVLHNLIYVRFDGPAFSFGRSAGNVWLTGNQFFGGRMC